MSLIQEALKRQREEGGSTTAPAPVVPAAAPRAPAAPPAPGAATPPPLPPALAMPTPAPEGAAPPPARDTVTNLIARTAGGGPGFAFDAALLTVNPAPSAPAFTAAPANQSVVAPWHRHLYGYGYQCQRLYLNSFANHHGEPAACAKHQRFRNFGY